MVQHYKIKTDRANRNEEKMRLAILSVPNKEMLLRKAAQACMVRKDALHRRIKKELMNVTQDSQDQKSLGAFKTVLS